MRDPCSFFEDARSLFLYVTRVTVENAALGAKVTDEIRPVRHRSGVMGPWDVYGPCSGGPRSASRYHVVGPSELTPASGTRRPPRRAELPRGAARGRQRGLRGP